MSMGKGDGSEAGRGAAVGREKEGKSKDEAGDGVVYYQPAPEGYEEPARENAGSVSVNEDKRHGQLGYIFDEASRPAKGGAGGTTTADQDDAAQAIGDADVAAKEHADAATAIATADGSSATSANSTSTDSAAADTTSTTTATTSTTTDPDAPSKPRRTRTSSLPSQIQQRRSEWRKKFETMMDNMQSNVFMAGQTLNDLTGYSAIERMKQEIVEQEATVRSARAHMRECKEAYTAAIARRSASQREVNELLQRKHAWAPADVERFTGLYRSDHANERAEAAAQAALTEAERASEEAGATLGQAILARYHEEQIWSDKIRRMSTWGTWGLMGVNVLLFLVFQVAVEPWRRRRLVSGFEEKVLDALERERELTVQREGERAREGEGRGVEAGQVVAAAAAAVEAVREAAREMRGVVGGVSEQFDAAEEQAIGDEVVFADADDSLAAAETAIAAPEQTTPQPLPLDEASLRMHFHQLVARTLSRLPPPLARRIVDHIRRDTTVSMSPRDLSTVALESAAAGAAVASVAAGLLMFLLRGQ